MSDFSRNYTTQAATNPYRIAKFGTADGMVIQAAAAGDALIGVFDELAHDSGERSDVVRHGPCLIELGGAVTRGELLTSDGNGKAVSAAPAAAITAATAANPGVLTSVGHPFVTGDRVAISAVAGMVELNGQTVTVTKLSADTFSIGVNTTAYTAYTSGGVATLVARAAGSVRTIGCADVSGVAGDIVPHIVQLGVL